MLFEPITDFFLFFSRDMMTDPAVQHQHQQQQPDMNSQTVVSLQERQAIIQKLTAKWTSEISKRVESLAYEKSSGIKSVYLKFIQSYYQQVQNAYQNRTNQQQQQQPMNNNLNYSSNQQVNPTQSRSSTVVAQPSLNSMLNQQIRFPSTPQPPRVMNTHQNLSNPQTNVVNTQSSLINPAVRLCEPSKFNSLASVNNVSYTGSQLNTTPTIQTIDPSKSYAPQQPNGTNPNTFLSQTGTSQSSYSIQQSVQPRAQTTTNLNGNVRSQPLLFNHTNDILHQFVVGNPLTNCTAPVSSSFNTGITTSGSITANSSPTGDRLLQQILLSNTDGKSAKLPSQNRTTPIQQLTTTQSVRSASTTNITNTFRPSLTRQQASPSAVPSVITMSNIGQTSTVQLPSSTDVTIQPSPLNNSNGSLSTTIPTTTQSLPTTNNSSPINRSLPLSGTGSISSPDDETLNLIKYLKENVGKLQLFAQKFFNEGNINKAREIQAFHQQMVQFISNPTYESLANAKQIRHMLERALNRSQSTTSNVPSNNEFNQFEKALTDFLSRDLRKRSSLSKSVMEPLNDVLNGVSHKRIRLDNDSYKLICRQIPSMNRSLISRLDEELNALPAEIFSIERTSIGLTAHEIRVNDEYLNKKGIILRCKLLETSHPLIPSLRLRISTRYPDEQPEVLSLTQTMPPKLEFTDGHPFFEQISAYFVSHLFKLHSQHTITDILNIWRQSVRTAL